MRLFCLCSHFWSHHQQSASYPIFLIGRPAKRDLTLSDGHCGSLHQRLSGFHRHQSASWLSHTEQYADSLELDLVIFLALSKYSLN